MTSSIPVSWGKDQLPCTRSPNAVNGSLIILEDQASGHVMRLVHDTKNDLGVIFEAACKLLPELSKLCSRCSIRVTGIADDTSSHWLLGRIVISHIIMRVEYRVCTFTNHSGHVFT